MIVLAQVLSFSKENVGGRQQGENMFQTVETSSSSREALYQDTQEAFCGNSHNMQESRLG